MNKNKKKKIKVSVWLSPDLYERAKKAAAENYQSFARWLTEILETKLKGKK
jgi:predicted DNA binding CopG/RHH family protein